MQINTPKHVRMIGYFWFLVAVAAWAAIPSDAIDPRRASPNPATEDAGGSSAEPERPISGAVAGRLPSDGLRGVPSVSLLAGPPINDICDNAKVIASSGETVIGDTRNATDDLGGQVCGNDPPGNTVWYEVQTSMPGRATTEQRQFHVWKASLCASYPDKAPFSDRIVVFCPDCDELKCVADSYGSTPSCDDGWHEVEWCAEWGETYYIAVGVDGSGNGGEFRLELSPVGSLKNECSPPDPEFVDCVIGACCNGSGCQIKTASECAGPNDYFMGRGSTCPCEGACCDATQPEGQRCEIIEDNLTLCSGGSKAFLGWGSTCPCPNQPGACCDDQRHCAGNVWVYDCENPATYFHEGVACKDVVCNDTHELALDITYIGPPVTIARWNVGAVVEDSLQPLCTGAGSKDIWFKYTASGTGTVLIDTCETYQTAEQGLDTILAVWWVPVGDVLKERGCNDDCTSIEGVVMPATCKDQDQTGFGETRDACVCVPASHAGQNFYIQVQGYAGATGRITVNVDETACDPDPLGACCLVDGSCAADEMREVECAADPGFASWLQDAYCSPELCSDEFELGCCCQGPGAPTESTQAECGPEGNWYPLQPGEDCGECPWEPNDTCPGAIVILDDPPPEPPTEPRTGVDPGSNVNTAYIDDHTSFCGTSAPPRVVWYTLNGYELEGSTGIGHSMSATTCTDDNLDNPFDTVLQVYCATGCSGGPCCDSLACVEGNDDHEPGPDEPSCDLLGQGDNLGSKVEWCAHPDATYYIAVGGYGGASGDFVLTVVDEPSQQCEPAGTCAVTGACCLADGTCDAGSESAPMTESVCNGEGGIFHEDRQCSEVQCEGACCVPTQDPRPDPRECNTERTTQVECEEVPGARFYPGENCSGFTCPECGDEQIDAPYEECDPPYTGICDYDCQYIFDPAVCSDPSTPEECCHGHDAPGCLTDDEFCCEDVCVQDPFCCNEHWDDLCAELALVTGACGSCAGACCDPQAEYPDCRDRYDDPPDLSRKVDCEGAGGVFIGPGTVCADDPCATGACCDAQGDCTETDRTGCIAPAYFVGWGTSCNGEDCLRVCCVSDTCSMTTKADCPDPEDNFKSEETACFPNPCGQPPANDDCAEATNPYSMYEIDIETGYAWVEVDNRLYTADPTDPPLPCHWSGHDPPRAEHTAWYWFEAPQNEIVEIRTCNTEVADDAAVDTIIGLYRMTTKCDQVGSQLRACGEDGCDEGNVQNPTYHARACYSVYDDYKYIIQLATSPGRPQARPGNIIMEVVTGTDVSCGVCCHPYNDPSVLCACDYTYFPWLMSQTECDAMSGTFVPVADFQGSLGGCDTCSELCDTGACCKWSTPALPPEQDPTNVECVDEEFEVVCAATTSIFHGDGTSCETVGCPPSHDRCDYASEWPLEWPTDCSERSVITVPNTWATTAETDPPFSCHSPEAGQGFGTLWYTFEVPDPAPETVRISTCTTDTDTLLAAYLPSNEDDPCGSVAQWNEIACSDDACGAGSEITLTDLEDEVGNTYYIQAASWSPESQGEITIDLGCALPDPPNDTCPGALTVALPWTIDGSTMGASPDDVPGCGIDVTAPGVWYKVTGTGKAVTASLCHEETSYDTKLSVFCGDCEDPICVAGNDDTEDCGGFQSKVEWCSEAGRDYWILVHGFGYAKGDFKLTVSTGEEACDPPPNCDRPVNDACAEPWEIALGVTGFSTINATDEGPSHSPDDCPWDGEIYRDIWFDYTATCTGNLTGTGNLVVSLCESADYDTKLAVYDGCDCGDLSLIGCNDDASGCAGYTSEITVPVVTGNCYKIRIGGFGTSDWGTGDVTLEYESSIPPEPPSQPGDPNPEAAFYKKVRYISFSPGNAGVSTAFRVTINTLPVFPDYYNPQPEEGDIWWVDQPVTYCENSGVKCPPCPPTQPSADFIGAPLKCNDPYYMDWHGTCDKDTSKCVNGLKHDDPCSDDQDCQGIVHVYGQAIAPGAEYEVQAIPQGCPIENEGYYSSPLVITTSVWGDVVHSCASCPCTPPDEIVNMTSDITAVLDKFRNLGPPYVDCPPVIKARADLDLLTPNQLVDISDATCALDAFRGLWDPPYPPPALEPGDGWPDGCNGP